MHLIDVGKGNGEESTYVHLSSGQRAPYAALSYCWGGPQPVTLTTLTMTDMLRGVATSTLPATIQDAITVTRKLGLRYLWVDSLCIFQDSTSDKDAEIAKMDQIYKNARLTISAASAERCQDGFLARRSWRGDFSPSTSYSSIPFACPNGKTGNVSLRESMIYYSQMEPLNRRGWALQESILSSRVLIYSSWQMLWQCQTRKNWEGGRADYFITDPSELSALENLRLEDESGKGNVSEETENALWTSWTDLVYQYSRRALTESSDKLPALSGLAARYQKDTNDVYCAGLWKANLLKGLKWQVPEPTDHRPSIYRAPTWSWASVLGEVLWTEYKPPGENSVASSTTMHDCRVTPENPLAPLGKVSGGTLTITGVSKLHEWNGDVEIPRPDLEPTWVPASERGIGSPLWPDGVVARVRPDTTEEVLYVRIDSGDQTLWEEEVFHMGLNDEGENGITRPVVLIVLDGDCALVLGQCAENIGEDICWTRIGLTEFKDNEALEEYFKGCEEKTFIIE